MIEGVLLLLLVLFDGRNDQQGLFTILGCMYGTTIFAGINNCQSVMPFVSIERSVVYRERFAGMYSPWAYSLAQVHARSPPSPSPSRWTTDGWIVFVLAIYDCMCRLTLTCPFLLLLLLDRLPWRSLMCWCR